MDVRHPRHFWGQLFSSSTISCSFSTVGAGPAYPSIRIILATPTRCRNLDAPGQPRRGHPSGLSAQRSRAAVTWAYLGNLDADAFRCRGRPLCLPIRIVLVTAFKMGRHRGLPLRVTQSSPRAAGQPDSPRTATGHCELQTTPQNPTCKTPPPNRLPPIHPRPRGTGAPHLSLWPSGSYVPRKRRRIKN